jgi:hypothetical protein
MAEIDADFAPSNFASSNFQFEIVDKPGRKLISYPETNHIQGSLRIRGNTKLPQGDQVITIVSTLSQLVAESIPYKCTIGSDTPLVLEGTCTLPTSTVDYRTIGVTYLSVHESVKVNGEKDYLQVINKLEQLVSENLD